MKKRYLYNTRRGVGLVLKNKDGLIFIGMRKGFPIPAWQLPQGGIEKGEKPKETLVREVKEEIGVDFNTQCRLIDEMPIITSYTLPSFSKAPFKRQSHKWFFAEYIGKEEDLNRGVNESTEFNEWQWATPDYAIKNAIDFKQAVYEEVFAYFNLIHPTVPQE